MQMFCVLGAEFMTIQNLRDSAVDLYSCCVMIRLVTTVLQWCRMSPSWYAERTDSNGWTPVQPL